MQIVTLSDLVSRVPHAQQAHAKKLFEKVFESLIWTRVEGNLVQDVLPLEQWEHRTLADIETDLAYLEINRQQVLTAFSEYLSSPSLTSKHADWLFLNVLTYAEYIATIGEVRRKLMGIERYVKSLFPPKSEHITDIGVFAKQSWHLPVTLVIIILGWAVHAFAGMAVTGCVLFAKHRRRKARKQVNETLASMLQGYLSFNTVDLSWTQVGSTLDRSREAGVMWDASLYALADQRVQV